MTEHSTPSWGNLSDDILDRLPAHGDDIALARADGEEWVDVTLSEFHRDVVALAKGLVGAGVAAGDRVVLLSKTRYEWTVADYAIWWTGAATVPIYETSSAAQIAWILSDSGAVAAIVENDTHGSKVEEARGEAPSLGHVWTIDTGGLDDLRAAGAGVSDDDLEQRRSALTSDTLATLIYTSGTTGRPKGCRLTHGNFRYELEAATEQLEDLFTAEGASTLLFLPLAHVFARVIQVGAIRSGARLGHTADVKDLVTHLGTFHPTFVLAVPRVFEKVFNSASGKAYADGKGKIFDRAVQTAIGYSRALDDGRPGLALRARHALFDRLVYGKLRDALGGEAAWAISGGAPLGDRLAHFYRGIGVTVLEGYGLTETTAALCVNTPDDQRIGTVGRPLPGTEVRAGDDGELSFRGDQVFGGYWHNDEATAEALDDDGWFATGDLGDVDDDGFVRITGRKKEIIVTAGGKNVAPAALEDPIRANPIIGQVIVVGDQKPFISALITLDEEMVPTWLKNNDLDGVTFEQAATHPKVLAEVQRAVDAANTTVSRAESIRKFVILDAELTEASGHLTPKLSIKRNVILKDFADEIEGMYNAAPATEGVSLAG